MAAEEVTVLHFVHGKYSGQEFALDAAGAIAGRSTEADLCLADDAVSRKHARFYLKRERCWVRDLGSRNGTLINGTAIDSHCLRAGDRIAIGSSLARIELRAAGEVKPERAGEQKRRRIREIASRSMTGSLEEVPLMDVLQWLATSRKTGTLGVRDLEAGRVGSIHLREGQAFYAAIEGVEGLHPDKALCRMIGWQKGMFELESASLETPPVEISKSLEHLLIEAGRQQDELAAMHAKDPLPALGAEVRLVSHAPVRWGTLDTPMLEVLQDLVEHGSWWAALDHSSRDDVTMHRALLELRKRGVVEW